MKILVSAKRVSDPNAKLAIAKDGKWIEGDVEYILNPFCENAIECALQIAEANDGTETVAVGIGDDETARFIRPPRPAFVPPWGPYSFFGSQKMPDCPYPLSPLIATE